LYLALPLLLAPTFAPWSRSGLALHVPSRTILNLFFGYGYAPAMGCTHAIHESKSLVEGTLEGTLARGAKVARKRIISKITIIIFQVYLDFIGRAWDNVHLTNGQ
jgi:hypothetical protein